jgi:hypothetical protein
MHGAPETNRTSDQRFRNEQRSGAIAGEAENTDDRDPKVDEPNRKTTSLVRSLPIEMLRAKLDAAIAAEQWDAVKIIGERLRERATVVNLDAARKRRHPRQGVRLT